MIWIILLIVGFFWIMSLENKEKRLQNRGQINRLRRAKLNAPNEFARELATIKALAQRDTGLFRDATKEELLKVAIEVEFETKELTEFHLREAERIAKIQWKEQEAKTKERAKFALSLAIVIGGFIAGLWVGLSGFLTYAILVGCVALMYRNNHKSKNSSESKEKKQEEHIRSVPFNELVFPTELYEKLKRCNTPDERAEAIKAYLSELAATGQRTKYWGTVDYLSKLSLIRQPLIEGHPNIFPDNDKLPDWAKRAA